ncbi:MAG: DUF4105 domain-containing protein [Terricaulis sp.]
MGVFRWFGANPLRPGLASIVLILLLGAWARMTIPARTERNWYPYLAHETVVQMQSDRFTVGPVTDWSYAPAGPTNNAYTTAAYTFDDVRAVWFVVEPDPNLSFAAHTFLMFEFAGDHLLGVTIEARREANEDYSPVGGAFNEFELAYLWGAAHDLLTRRTVMLQHKVHIYPLSVTNEQLRTLLTNMLQRTKDLETHPRFYNTVFANCTNEIAYAAKLDWGPAFILTGEADEYLYKRRLMPGPNLQAVRAQADFTDVINRLNASPEADFDAAILAEMRARRTKLTG